MVYHMVHGVWFKPSTCASLQGCWARCLERSRATVAWGEAEKKWPSFGGPERGACWPRNDGFHGANCMIIWYNLSVGCVENHWKPMDCVWIRGFWFSWFRRPARKEAGWVLKQWVWRPEYLGMGQTGIPWGPRIWAYFQVSSINHPIIGVPNDLTQAHAHFALDGKLAAMWNPWLGGAEHVFHSLQLHLQKWWLMTFLLKFPPFSSCQSSVLSVGSSARSAASYLYVEGVDATEKLLQAHRLSDFVACLPLDRISSFYWEMAKAKTLDGRCKKPSGLQSDRWHWWRELRKWGLHDARVETPSCWAGGSRTDGRIGSLSTASGTADFQRLCEVRWQTRRRCDEEEHRLLESEQGQCMVGAFHQQAKVQTQRRQEPDHHSL